MIDALTWLERRTQRPATRAWLLVLFALPLLKGLVNRLTEGGVSFGDDWQAVVCAARQVAASGPLYGEGAGCAAFSHTPYVYLPWVAEGLARLNGLIGEPAALIAYGAVYAVAVAVLAWVLLLRRTTPGPFPARILFLGLITGSAIALGNVAIPLHALVLVTALVLPVTVIPFALALGLAGAVKPVLLTYGVVLLLAPIGWGRRLVAGLAALVLALGPLAWAVQQGWPAFIAWQQMVATMAVDTAPGDGLWGWLALFGLSGTNPIALALAAGYGLALLLAGLLVAHRGGLDGGQRIWLGLSVGVLLIPRLMAIDLFLLGPGLIVLALVARHVFAPASWLVVGGAALGLFLDLVDAGDYAIKVAVLAFVLALLTTAVALLFRPVNAGSGASP